MGRSRSRNRTRSVTSNQRLRSDSHYSVPSPQTVPYLDLSMTRAYLGSPTLTPTIYSTPRVYNAPRINPPSQPPRPNVAGAAKLRTYTPPVASSSQAVSQSPRSPEERQTMVCVRRQQRREVLHAFSQTGKGGQKSPIYNWQSKIHCKGRK